jgi:hypothetical protein
MYIVVLAVDGEDVPAVCTSILSADLVYIAVLAVDGEGVPAVGPGFLLSTRSTPSTR